MGMLRYQFRYQSGWLRWIPLAALAALAPGMTSAAQSSPPDLSGIWSWHIEPGKSPFGRLSLDLPLTPEGRRKVDEYRSIVGPDDNPGAHCLGSGMPESMTFSGGYPMEIIQRPEQITIIYEAHSEIRRLYFGAKALPEADRVPSRNGYSTARWEGNTLVVETTSLKEQEDQSYPHSDQARITERYHLTNDAKGNRVLEVDWTLTDPVFYTRPVSSQKKWTFDPKGVLLPYECNEEAWLDRLEELKKHKGQAASAAKY